MSDSSQITKKTPLRELCDQALKHYEEISNQAMHYNSLIPQAIRFYQKNYRKPFKAYLRCKEPSPKCFHCQHIIECRKLNK